MTGLRTRSASRAVGRTRSQTQDGSLLIADVVVLLASSVCDLRPSPDLFAAECEVAGMRISTLKIEREIDGWIGAASAVMRTLRRSVVVKIYPLIFVPTLTYGHKLWVVTEITRS